MHHTFNVYLAGKKLETVFDSETSPAEVKRSLVNHDGYDPGITVRAVWRQEYVVQGSYGCGWEDVNSEETRRDAKRSLREYDNNEAAPHRLVIRKVQC